MKGPTGTRCTPLPSGPGDPSGESESLARSLPRILSSPRLAASPVRVAIGTILFLFLWGLAAACRGIFVDTGAGIHGGPAAASRILLAGLFWCGASLLAGALSILALARAARGEGIPVLRVLGHVLRRRCPFIVGPIFPLLGAAALGGLASLGFVLHHVPVAGGVLASLWLFLVVLPLGIGAGFLSLLAAGAWTLIPPAAAAESGGFFEASSRGLSYVRRAPARLLAYLLAGWVAVLLATALYAGVILGGVGAVEHAAGFLFGRELLPERPFLPGLPWVASAVAGWLPAGQGSGILAGSLTLANTVLILSVPGFACAALWGVHTVVYLAVRWRSDGLPPEAVVLPGESFSYLEEVPRVEGPPEGQSSPA